MKLRPYQKKAEDDINAAWVNNKNALLVLPTGAGKTVTFSHVINSSAGATCAIAHRQELVLQISVALAREGVRHTIIAPAKVIKTIIKEHVNQFGTSYYDGNSLVAVAGVDTLTRKKNDPLLADWFNSVKLWVVDEAHHVLKGNKWGKACELFPNARGLGVTATPTRSDGNGLSFESDGLFNCMIEGPTMRELIDMGYLTDYRIFAPPSDLVLDDVKITAGGDYNREGLKNAVKRSHIIGDVVKHYVKIAAGKRGITFTPDIETAEQTAEQFNAAGVPALAVSGETPDKDREAAKRKLETGEVLQLVNCDLFGEGYDLPAIEVVSMARPTQSLSLYIQQFGRALRLLEGKQYAIIIDHVGNVQRHGLPDAARQWSLERREKRTKADVSDAIPVTTCVAPLCGLVYERIHKACPYCGHLSPPAKRTAPEFVDGDLVELDLETLKEMRAEVAKMDLPVDKKISKAKYAAGFAMSADRRSKLEESYLKDEQAQSALRSNIALWAGYRRDEGKDDSTIYKLFYFKFGLDIMTAQTLKHEAALTLNDKIEKYLL